MHPDQTAATGAVCVYETSNILGDDKNIHFVITGFKG